jgi:glycosyltransferase involved in cell wall biosynthesis
VTYRLARRQPALAPPRELTVSVVIPCYNYGRYLEGCIGSVLSQKHVQVSILVIDDCSTDDSLSVARAIAAREPRVEVLAHEVNRGHLATYNEGLARASGDLCVLLSADDLLVPGALARASAVFATYPNIGLVYGRTVYFIEDRGLPTPSTESGQHVVWNGLDWAASRCLAGSVGIVSPEVVVRTELQHAVGGYRSNLPHSGDSEMWLRFATRADVAFVDADHAYYRMHAASMSKSQFNTRLADARERHHAYMSAFSDEDAAGYDAAAFRMLASKGVASEVLWDVCRAIDRGEADSQMVEQLVAFAEEIYPEIRRLPDYRRLRIRRRLGRRAAQLAPLWLPDLVVHRIRRVRTNFGENWWWHLRS